MNSAAATAAVKFAGARSPRFVKYSVTSESEPELAESSEEAEPGRARPSRKVTVEASTLVPRERVQWSADVARRTAKERAASP